MVEKSRPELFCRKGVLRNVAKFTVKHLCQSLFFNKVTGQAPFLTELFRWLLFMINNILKKGNALNQS